MNSSRVPLTLVISSEFSPDSSPQLGPDCRFLYVSATIPEFSSFLFWNPESQTFSSTFIETHCYIVLCVIEGHVSIPYITPRDL